MGFPALGVALTGLLQAVSATFTFTFLPNSKDPVSGKRQRQRTTVAAALLLEFLPQTVRVAQICRVLWLHLSLIARALQVL
jgi:hypothetical protein